MELIRQKNVATRIYFPLVDAAGALVAASANPDSEFDTWDDGSDPNGFADCNQEAVHVGGGWYELNLIQAEMNFDYIAVQVKSDDALTQCILINTIVGDPSLRATTVATDAIETKVDTAITDIGNLNDFDPGADTVEIGVAGIPVGGFAEAAINATAMANNAISGDAFSGGAADKVWASIARTITGGVLTTPADYKADVTDMATNTNVDANETKIDTVITDIGNLENLSSANVQTVLETNDLDHLIKIAHPTGDPVADSLIDLIMNKDGGQTFDRAADSLEKLGEGGGGGATAQQVWEYANGGGRALTTPNDYKATVTDYATETNATTNTTNIQTNIDANETKIDLIQTDTTAIDGKLDGVITKTDNLPADTEAVLNRLKALHGEWMRAEYTHDGNDDNTVIGMWFYDTVGNWTTHDKSTGLVAELELVATFTNNLPDDTKVEVKS